MVNTGHLKPHLAEITVRHEHLIDVYELDGFLQYHDVRKAKPIFLKTSKLENKSSCGVQIM